MVVGTATLALIIVASAVYAAEPSDPAGLPFVTFAHARAQQDYVRACRQLVTATLRHEFAAADLSRSRTACERSLASSDEDADAEHRRSFASTRVVNVRVTPGWARVTVQTTLYGLQPRATGTAVIENGQWKIAALPSNAHVGQSYLSEVTNSSMEPTLQPGDTVLVDHAAYEHAAPRIGDLIVFHPPIGAKGSGRCGKRPPIGQACAVATPRNSQTNFLKRIVAGPGDRVAIHHGRVSRNGRMAKEAFVRPCHPKDDCNFPRTFTVAPGRYYVLGDNRGASADSRYWGPVARHAIVGRVTRLDPNASP